MGNLQASGVIKGDLIELLDLELPIHVEFEKQLGQGKILKSAKVKWNGSHYLVIKIYVKPGLNTNNQYAIERLEDQIENYRKIYLRITQKWTLDKQPGLIPLKPISNKNIQTHLHKGYFLGRQYFSSNLYDRFNTKPYLSYIEKKWIVYQLLRAIQQAHQSKIIHGDIKCENIVLTSWLWLFLTDFNPYKPKKLPDNHPFQFTQFFEGTRPRCYIAPERFYVNNSNDSNKKKVILSEKADIFSFGCCVAEIFMDGKVLFDHPQLLSYKTNKYDPKKLIKKEIKDINIRNLVM